MGDAFRVRIDKLLKSKYEEIMKKDFSDFYNGVSCEFVNLENVHSRDLAIKNLNRAIKTTKGRWVDKIISDNKSTLFKDIELAQYQYNRVLSGEITLKAFEDLFKVKNVDEYKNILLNEIEAWKCDTNALLSDFCYLKSMNKLSLGKAFKNDILLLYARHDSESEDCIPMTKVPSIMSIIPIDTTGRIDFLTNDEKKKIDSINSFEEASTIDRYIMIDEEDQDKLLIQLEQNTYLKIKSGVNPMIVNDLLTQIALIKAIKYLNRIDVKIIRYYYTHFHNMVLGEPIVKSINTIVKEIGMTDAKKNYDAVENSIAKLGSIHLSYNLEGNSINGVFLESKIYELNGAKIADVYLGNILKELIIKKSTLEYDESVFNSLGDDAQQLAIWLQKKRFACEINEKEYKEELYLKQFGSAIYWNNKNHYRQRDRIKSGLEELKKNKLIVKNFKYDNKQFKFYIEYIQLSMKEKSKLESGMGDKNKKLLEDSVSHNVL